MREDSVDGRGRRSRRVGRLGRFGRGSGADEDGELAFEPEVFVKRPRRCGVFLTAKTPLVRRQRLQHRLVVEVPVHLLTHLFACFLLGSVGCQPMASS